MHTRQQERGRLARELPCSKLAGEPPALLPVLRGCHEQLQIDCIEPLIELLAHISQMRDFLKSEFLVQPNARCLIRRDVRQNGTKARVPCRINQCLEQLTPNPLTLKITMHIDGVFQHTRSGIGGSE